jgi:chitinase
MLGKRLVTIMLAVSSLSLCAQAAHQRSSTEVVGYVFPRDEALQPGQVDGRRMTRINYAFANIKDGRMVTGYAKDAENFATLTALRKQNPSLKILVSVGGWLWSTNFSDVALTTASRQVFIASAMDFLTRYDLDGLDIDWEYPGMPGAGHPFRPEDKQNFTLLLKELRARFGHETGMTHKRLYLTIAAGASKEYLAHTEMNKVQKYVDSVNLMTYDFVNPGSDPGTGHNSPLYTNPAAPVQESSNDTVLEFEKAGVRASKLYLGLPFYGRVWSEVADRNHGLFQPGKQAPNSWASYQVIAQTMLNGGGEGFARYWDAKASAPWLYNAEKHLFVTYDDSESITAKCNYALAHRLGGVMFWEYASDPSGTLLGAIDKALHAEPRAAKAQ